MTDQTTDAAREAKKYERLEIEASNNLAHAFQNTPRNSDAIASLGWFVARYRDAVEARVAAAVSRARDAEVVRLRAALQNLVHIAERLPTTQAIVGAVLDARAALQETRHE